jgi:hypothetical protein
VGWTDTVFSIRVIANVLSAFGLRVAFRLRVVTPRGDGGTPLESGKYRRRRDRRHLP